MMKYWRTIGFSSPSSGVRCYGAKVTVRLSFALSFSLVLSCTDGASTFVTVALVRDEGVVSALFQDFRSLGPCMFGMVPPLGFGFLFAGQKELGVDLPLRFQLWILMQYEILGRRFAKMICF